MNFQISRRLFYLRKSYFSFLQAPKIKIDLNEDIDIARKQVNWRIRNLGMVELEILLGRWANANLNQLSHSQLKTFTEEILEKEIPELNSYFIKNEKIPENAEYAHKIRSFLYKN